MKLSLFNTVVLGERRGRFRVQIWRSDGPGENAGSMSEDPGIPPDLRTPIGIDDRQADRPQEAEIRSVNGRASADRSRSPAISTSPKTDPSLEQTRLDPLSD